LVTRNYWWPEVAKGIVKYVDGFDMCQRMKNHTEALAEKLIANKIYLIVDFIIKLLVAEKDAILVVHDRLFKIAHFVAITECCGNY